MARRSHLAAILAIAGASLSAQQPPTPPAGAGTQEPTFKLAVDYVEVDAVVTDGNGGFVRGLTKDDFKLSEDGKPQAISSFSFVDIPVERAARPTFARAPVPPDVRSNASPFDGRVYVMVIDDLHTEPGRTAMVESAARQFVQEDLGANDLMAVIHTFGPQDVNQSFTNSKPLLMAAINRTNGQKLPSAALNINHRVVPPGTPATDEDDSQRARNAQLTLELITKVSDWLEGIRNRRKAILLVGEGITYDIGTWTDPFKVGAGVVTDATRDAIEAATHANAAIYAIDPTGLTVLAAGQDIAEQTYTRRDHMAVAQETQRRQESLRALSDETGGFAVVERNDFAKSFQRIVDENSMYYLLAYYPATHPHDGKFHKIDVQVDRPGLTVRARKGYLAPRFAASAPPAPSGAASDVQDVLKSPLPVSGVTMSVFAAPFKGTAGDDSVLLGTELRGRDLQLAANDSLELSYIAIDATGKTIDAQTYPVTLNLDAAARARVEQTGIRLLNRLALPPGEYELRVAARDAAGGKAGSVVYGLEVPDFHKAPLVLSGVVLTSALGAATPTPRPDPLLRGVLPAPPVALRAFPQNDTVIVYGEAYDNKPSTPHKVNLTTTVTDADAKTMYETIASRDSADLKGKPGGYGFTARVPMSALPVGSYVLTIAAESTEGGEPASRRIPFTVVPPVPAPTTQQ